MECPTCRLLCLCVLENRCTDCQEEHNGRPRANPLPTVKAAALIIRDKKLLLVRTMGRPWFYAVGGKVEPGETDIQCLHREVEEEIGCHVTSERFYQTFRGPNTEGTKSMVMPSFFVTLDQEPRACSEIEELLWVDSKTEADIIGSMGRDHIIPSLKKDGLIN